ncbi:hypothetical protein DN402_02685 [Streptomyces sp. SW4]|nr:hypothetical protein DN402_02685 [Streptomyces sp. SW4]
MGDAPGLPEDRSRGHPHVHLPDPYGSLRPDRARPGPPCDLPQRTRTPLRLLRPRSAHPADAYRGRRARGRLAPVRRLLPGLHLLPADRTDARLGHGLRLLHLRHHLGAEAGRPHPRLVPRGTPVVDVLQRPDPRRPAREHLGARLGQALLVQLLRPLHRRGDPRRPAHRARRLRAPATAAARAGHHQPVRAPAQWTRLAAQASTAQPRLREATTAGEPLAQHVTEIIGAEWGVTVREGYGQTETTALVGTTPGLPHKPGWLGKPLPGWQLSVVDEQLYVELADAPVGMMAGYDGDPERTRGSSPPTGTRRATPPSSPPTVTYGSWGAATTSSSRAGTGSPRTSSKRSCVRTRPSAPQPWCPWRTPL